MKDFKRIIGVFCVLTIFSAMALGSGSSGSVSKVDPNSSGDASVDASATEESKDVVAKLGETLDFNGLQLTFDSIERYVDTTNGFVLDKAAEGKEFVILWFTVSNNTESSQYLNMFYEDSYCDDYSVDPQILLYNYKGDTLLGSNVSPGKKAKGYICYQLDTTWQKLEFYYSPDIWKSSSKMMFEATPADIA